VRDAPRIARLAVDAFEQRVGVDAALGRRETLVMFLLDAASILSNDYGRMKGPSCGAHSGGV
jgi:hypothetical protein